MLRTDAVQTYAGGKDVGYLGDNQKWWFDSTFEHSFTLFDLDAFYPDNYFENDHVGATVVKHYVDFVLEYGLLMLGREVQSILEMGCAGGWFTNEFLRRSIDIIAVEGTVAGVKKAVKRGVPPELIVRHDLRQPLDLQRKFDLVLCTEVAEHIECPFSGQLISNLVNHSDLVWFSFEGPGGNEAAYHHCNEQPAKFWRNLFRYYGYNMLLLPESVTTSVEGRGKYICNSERLSVPEALIQDDGNKAPELIGLGAGQTLTLESNGKFAKRFVKKITPPIFIDMAKALREIGNR